MKIVRYTTRPKVQAARKIWDALQLAGYESVTLWFEPIGASVEMCGPSGGWFFRDKNENMEWLGYSWPNAVTQVREQTTGGAQPMSNAGRSTTGGPKVPYSPASAVTEAAKNLRLQVTRYLGGRSLVDEVNAAIKLWFEATGSGAVCNIGGPHNFQLVDTNDENGPIKCVDCGKVEHE